MSRIMRWLMAGLVLVVLSGCGGGGNPHADDFAVFRTYAQNNGAGTAPTVQDYIDAGVIGVTAANLDDVNEAVAGLDPDAVDSEEELQRIADRFGLNTVPTANAGDDKNITEGEITTLTCSGSDADGDTLSYRWLDGTTELATTATYTTPAGLSVGEHTYTCEVNDGKAKATDEAKVTVNAAANVAPVADINATPTTATYGTTISFDASGSSDSDGSISIYRWSEGGTTLSTAVNFTKDDLGLGTHTITLTVTDDDGATGTATVDIVIQASTQLKKTGQTKSYDENGTEVTDGSIRDDGYCKSGVISSYSRDDATNIVTDHLTGLEWQDDASVATVTKPWVTQANYDAGNYDDTSGDTATTYCSDLDLGGYTDWRLPTSAELEGIVDYSEYYPVIDTTYFNNVSSNLYWSSTTYEGSRNYAWVVHFNYGYVRYNYKDNSYYVRCVRAGQP